MLVDDHIVLREWLKFILRNEPDLTMIRAVHAAA